MNKYLLYLQIVAAWLIILSGAVGALQSAFYAVGDSRYAWSTLFFLGLISLGIILFVYSRGELRKLRSTGVENLGNIRQGTHEDIP